MQTVVAPANRVGIVVIGRNEGDRLIACLNSVSQLGCSVVYVDSGSSDGSVRNATSLSERVVELDGSSPFSAARARNEGFRALMAEHPFLSCIQFLDGDCTLMPDWLGHACEALDADAARAVVIGPLQERRPEASIYNRLCQLEWRSAPGDLSNFGALGGIMLVRSSVFSQVHGFNPEVIAGEDSEFGIRVAGAGFKITKIDAPMATHDADIRRFGQWWRRAVRGGHAIGQRFSLNGRGALRDCARERRSVLIWGLGLPLTIVSLAPFTAGLSFLLLGGYLVLGRRIVNYRRSMGDTHSDARLYACFVVLGKFAEAIGWLRFHVNRISGKYRTIEYK